MGAVAVALFIGLFVFGGPILGVPMGDGHVQASLLAAFVLGIVCGWKSNE